MANPDQKSQAHTQKTNSNPLQEPGKKIGMTEQDYKTMIWSCLHFADMDIKRRYVHVRFIDIVTIRM